MNIRPRIPLPAPSCRCRESGAALITSLVFLVMLTLMSLTVFNNAVLQGRMSGNLRDRQIAYSAAEAALRDAEKYVRGSGRICGWQEAGSDESDSQSCTNGFCYNGNNMKQDGNDWLSEPVFAIPGSDIDDNEKWSNAIVYGDESGATADADYYRKANIVGVNYSLCTWVVETDSTKSGYYTEPADLPLVSQQPRYLIEVFRNTADQYFYYRITVRAWGSRAGTQVRLQSIFSPMK